MLGSEVHREKWLDTQRNEAVLPRQEGAITREPRDYSRVARKDQRRPQEGHGGADAAVVTGSLRFVGHGGATNTSPVAAREAVTASLRSGGTPFDVPPLAPTAAYFVAHQPGSRGPATTRSLGPDRRPRA